MKILVLDATTKVLKADLAANPTTNPDYVISYADVDSSTFTEGSADGALTGTTSATLLTGLGSGSKRIVKSISIHNRDSNTITVYLKLDNNGTVRVIEKIVLAAGEAWHNDTQAGGGGTGRPSGSDTQVQFNDGGVFGGNSGLLFDKTTTTLTAANLVVSGGLTVNGTTTNINSTNLVVEDKNIVIGDVATPTDTTANGGGITLLGATNKTIAWDSTNSNWTSSEHWNLASTKDFKINNVSVLNATTLGSSVTSSSLTSLGTLASLTVSGSASLATTSGSVAIATTSPSAGYRLHVAGDVRIANLGSESGALQISQESLQAVIQTRYSQPLVFGTNATERMRIDSSGNVGLGVAPSAWGSPFIAFESGSVSNQWQSSVGFQTNNSVVSLNTNTFYNGSNYIYKYSKAASRFIVNSNSFEWQLAPSGTANTTTITNGVSYTIITSGNQTSFGAANNNVGTVFTATSSGTLSSGTVSQNITFTQAMTLDASGNLGVGATSPGSFNGNQLYGAVIGNGTSLPGLTLYGGSSSGGSLNFADGTTGTEQYRGSVEYNHGSDYMAFRTSGTIRVRIDSGGDFRVKGAGTAGSTDAFQVSGSAPADAARITSGGNLGVGATSPNGRVESRTATVVPGDSAYAKKAFVANIPLSTANVTSSLVAAFDNTIHGADVGYSYDGTGYYLAFATNSTVSGSPTERARITSTGDLLPGANGTQNFGSSSLRWNTIYTSDLSLSNGIGDWTIVEGEDDLFIYNNKRNRVYKFKLEAVDPSTATPKREV